MGRLSAKAGRAFDLPTEARWEYACRAGTLTSLNSGKNVIVMQGVDPNVDEVSWYMNNSGNYAHDGAGRQVNRWGLYDMHGNVYEFCIDFWIYQYPWWNQTVDPVGPPAPGDPARHVARGSCYIESPQNHRSADRWAVGSSIAEAWYGFRAVAEAN